MGTAITVKRAYDLEERTGRFGEDIIRLCKSVPFSAITKRIVDQLVRAGTSVGANYMEANGASSKKDFRNKIFIVRKECQETKYWLRMLSTAEPEQMQLCQQLGQECHELILIFQKIGSSLSRFEN